MKTKTAQIASAPDTTSSDRRRLYAIDHDKVDELDDLIRGIRHLAAGDRGV